MLKVNKLLILNHKALMAEKISLIWRLTMSDISLTASMRSNLLSLQSTQSLMDRTQDRLSTGKKVNSAIDNPMSYYTSQSLTNRAGDLEDLLDSMGQGIQTIKAANEGIESITAFVQQAKAVANTARDTSAKAVAKSNGTFENKLDAGKTTDVILTIGDVKLTATGFADTSDLDDLVTALTTGANQTAYDDSGFTIEAGTGADEGKLIINVKEDTKLADQAISLEGAGQLGISLSGKLDNTLRDSSMQQYNDILVQIDQLASDASYKGVNLLRNDDLKVVFNEDRSSYLEIKGDDASSNGLGLSPATDWNTNEAVDAVIEDIEGAINELRDMASVFGNNYSIVQTRQDFTENLVNVLEEGSDNLILADMNEESANMLALQTRQQLAINSLSLASQAAQSVLQLFG